MGRLSRVELRERNRARVLAAAGDEFAERGFRDTKVDGIAARAGLTRGAVYSNFPGKRALYFEVLADLAERAPGPLDADPPPAPALTAGGQAPARAPLPAAREALGAFARAWLARLPLADTDEKHGAARLGMDVLPEVLAEEWIRRPYAQLTKLNAIILGLALERLDPPGTPPASRVRVAEAVLTTLHGAAQLAAAAPGFVEPFNVVSACEQLAGLELGGWWAPSHVRTPVRLTDDPWFPPHLPRPRHSLDVVRGGPAYLAGDGVLAILGLHRLEAVEEAVRAAPAGARVTAVLVTGDPDELAPLARLAVADLCGPLRHAFPASAWPRLQVLVDTSGAVAAAAGVSTVGDGTEAAVRVEAGRIVSRADGRGACHAVATADAARTP